MEPLRRDSGRPVDIRSHALENLRFIRSTIESATAFTAVPGRGGIVMGLLALAAALLATRPAFAPSWLTIWISTGLVAAVVGLTTMWRKSASQGERLFGRVGRRFFLGLTPPILAAAALTPFLARLGSSSVVAGCWLLLYGAAVIAAGMYSIRLVPVMGALFMLLGGICLASPPQWASLYLGLGFGGVHIVFGTVIARRYGG